MSAPCGNDENPYRSPQTVPFILQAQRVLRWAKEIERHRLPLSGSREYRLPPATAGSSGQTGLTRSNGTAHGENR